MARAGGPNGTGAVFKVSRDGTSFKVLHTFGAVTSDANAAVPVNLDGASPLGVLLQGADGFLYGTTSVGGVNGRGTIFRVGTDGSGFQLQHVFAALPDSGSPPVNVGGASPLAGLTDGKDGRFYGVASGGGTNGVGTIFAFDPVGRLFSVMHNFEDSNGDTPAGAMILGLDTRLYGTTAFGGTTSNGSKSTLGTIFSIARDGTGFSKLYSFDKRAGLESAGPIAADERDDPDRRCDSMAAGAGRARSTSTVRPVPRSWATPDAARRRATRAAARRRPRCCC